MYSHVRSIYMYVGMYVKYIRTYLCTHACVCVCVCVCVRVRVGLHIIEIREKVHLNKVTKWRFTMLFRNTLYHVNNPERSSFNRHTGTRTDKHEEDTEIGFEPFVKVKESSRHEGFAANSSNSKLVLFFRSQLPQKTKNWALPTFNIEKETQYTLRNSLSLSFKTTPFCCPRPCEIDVLPRFLPSVAFQTTPSCSVYAHCFAQNKI